MNTYYKYFEAQDPGEEIIMTVRKHWINLTYPIIAGLGVIVLSGLILYYLGVSGSNNLFETQNALGRIGLAIIVLFSIMTSYIAWLLKYLTIFLITNERLVSISQLGLFVRKTSVLEFSSVEDVSAVQKGFLATIFNYGSVLIQTAGEKLNFEVSNVPDPEKIQDKIMELRDKFVVLESEKEELRKGQKDFCQKVLRS